MPNSTPPVLREYRVKIPIGSRRLDGILSIPRNACGVVIFAHGSGSSRFSRRNQFIAKKLQGGGLATHLLDLLDDEEADDRDIVFNIELLSDRLQNVADWLFRQPETKNLSIGFFGASTGAAAALIAAAKWPGKVSAVACRGGRTDLAFDWLEFIQAPTLLIVGGKDAFVRDGNERTMQGLGCPSELVVVPDATNLFEEPGALEQVAGVTKDWFLKYLA